jgi:serine/threonine protein kinase
MAPESVMDRKYSPSSDVWAFGVTLYELITRSEPYEDLDPVQAATKVCMGQIQLIVFPKFLINNVSRGLNEVIKKCLNKDPLQRPSMKQICTMFEPITP